MPKTKDKIKDFEKIIGYEFKNKNLLTLALTHPSYSKEESYQRLEFLGDLVLDAIVGIALFKKHKTKNESFLTDLNRILTQLLTKGFSQE